MKMIRTFLFVCVLSGVSVLYGQKAKHTFALGDSVFLLDNKPFQMISGEMHYPRVPREAWRERMKMAKAMGINTIGTYVFWNLHEPEKGKFDFSGNNDIAQFVKIAQEEGLWVILRPSPYVCAEWEFGGYPYWLQNEKGMVVRSNNEQYLKDYETYIKEVGKQLAPLQINHGGNILMVQIENEYGSYASDKEYLAINQRLFKEAGFDGLLYTCDPAKDVAKGYLPGLLTAVNGLDDPAKLKALVNKYHDGHGPYYIAEWYPGWFDDWGIPHSRGHVEKEVTQMDKVLAAGISINMYMFHGGTTRGFMNGADMKPAYLPDVSSYDYDAPVDEAGNATSKFQRFRDVISKYLPAGVTLPPVPKAKPTMAIANIRLTSSAAMFSALPIPVSSAKPLCFEDLNQAYGYVLYRTKLSGKGMLQLKDMRDFAIVYINGKYIGSLDRRIKQDSIQINNDKKDATLDIWVENSGRVNFGPYLTDNKQGLKGGVWLNGAELLNWKMYKFPFKSVSSFKFSAQTVKTNVPSLYKGSFTVTEPMDTYLNLSAFGKGFVFVNGHNLGRYWQIGPQQTIYLPAEWLKKGQNEIVVFDELKYGHQSISSQKEPILDQLAKN